MDEGFAERIGERIDSIDKIGVLRASALGDFIFTLPALDALRAAYPRAEIVLLGRPLHAELLAGRPGPVDRISIVPHGAIGDESSPTATPAEIEAFFAQARAERFDLALQLHGGGRNSNPFVRRLGARHTAGLKTPDAEPLDRWVPYVYFQQEILRYLEVVSLVGAPPVRLVPRLQVIDADVEEANAALTFDKRPLVALHPGASDPRRRWPAESFAAVGDALARRGARVIVTGVPDERDLTAIVVDAMREPAEDLAGRLSLRALVGTLARCALVVSNDTGPRHLADALGTATVGIYWCGNMINGGPLTRSRHRPLVAFTLRCAVCGVDCVQSPVRCPHDPSFVADVTVDAVLEQALDLLETAASPEDAAQNVAATAPRGAALMAILDVLIPTYRRPAALAVTLTALIGQTWRDFRTVVSDQGDDAEALTSGEVQAVVRVLTALGNAVELHHHLPRRGLAEHRQFLLDRATAPYVLFLDDDVILEPDVLGRMLAAIRAEECGFVGMALTGLKYEDVVRPHEEAIELWDGPVRPEVVQPGTPAWERHRLHNACNLYNLQRRLGITPERQRTYKVAWVGGCVLYDTARLRAVGGFSFWKDLPPEHCGEDVLAQLRVMARYGGCGLIPTGAYHQDLPTTVEDRRLDAPNVLPIDPTGPASPREGASESDRAVGGERGRGGQTPAPGMLRT